MRKLFQLLLLSIITISGVYCQTDARLWTELELELFPENQEMQLLYTLIDCPENKIDSTTRIRKNQPNANKVFSILSEIMHKKDANDFGKLKNIYERHIHNFMQEWSRVYLNNHYACDPILEQYSLLSGFEIVLTSLYFQQQGLSNKEIFEFCIHQMKLYDHVSRKTSRSEWLRISEQYKVFSTHYKELNPLFVKRGIVPFHYLDPYLEDLSSYFISYLEKCDWNDKSKEDDCMIVWSLSHFYSRIKDDKILEYFMNNFNVWKENYRHTYIYSYAGKTFKPKLSHFLVEKWIEEKDSILNKPQYKSIPILFLLRHEANIPIVLNHLVEYANKDFEHALKLFDYIRIYRYTDYLNDMRQVASNKEIVERIMKQLNISKN